MAAKDVFSTPAKEVMVGGPLTDASVPPDTDAATAVGTMCVTVIGLYGRISNVGYGTYPAGSNTNIADVGEYTEAVAVPVVGPSVASAG
jgi:hypothetical protein